MICRGTFCVSSTGGVTSGVSDGVAEGTNVGLSLGAITDGSALGVTGIVDCTDGVALGCTDGAALDCTVCEGWGVSDGPAGFLSPQAAHAASTESAANNAAVIRNTLLFFMFFSLSLKI